MQSKWSPRQSTITWDFANAFFRCSSNSSGVILASASSIWAFRLAESALALCFLAIFFSAFFWAFQSFFASFFCCLLESGGAPSSTSRLDYGEGKHIVSFLMIPEPYMLILECISDKMFNAPAMQKTSSSFR